MKSTTAIRALLTGLLISCVLTLFNDASPLKQLRQSGKPGVTSTRARRQTGKQQVGEKYEKLPLTFEANQGQADTRIAYVTRGASYTLSLLPGEAMLALIPASRTSRPEGPSKKGVAIRLKFLGANDKSTATGQEELPGKVNYFLGKDSARWITGIPTFAKVVYESVYPGVDLIWYGNRGQLEYDFIVTPGADPRQITMLLEGAQGQHINSAGDLILRTGIGNVRQTKPVIYQIIDGVQRGIEGGYITRGRDRVGFQIAAWDKTKPLVIDPTLTYSTLLGGGVDDFGQGIAVDASGSAYLTGVTLAPGDPSDPNFPTTPDAIKTSNTATDAFFTKLNPSGSALVYSTFLGGTTLDIGYGIAVDGSGGAYITGVTNSSDFPMTPGAFQTSLNGSQDAFVMKFGETPTPLQVGPPTNKDQCKKDGWRQFNTPRTFKNQGDCIQFVNTGK